MNTKAILAILSVTSNSLLVTANDWQYSSGGEFQSCPSGKYALGLCGSGDDGKCKDSSNGDDYKNAMECDPFPVQTSDENFQYNAGSWKCYDSGTQASCDTNEVITGICGSGKNDQCMDQCGSDKNTKYSFALRCAPIPNDIFLDSGDWEDPQDSGKLYKCPSGQVACGACFSDNDPHCQGNHFRAKCCTPSSPLNITGTLGWWEFQYAVSTDGEDTLTVGISDEQAHSKTQTWSDSVTLSVKESLQAKVEIASETVTESLSETQSQSVSETQSDTWTRTETNSFTLTYTDDQIGYVVWQWKTGVTDNQGCDSFDSCAAGSKDYALTPDASVYPKCLPGYWLNGDTSYQTCVEGYYLPGYEPSAAPTMMPSSAPSEVPSSSPSLMPTFASTTAAPTEASTTESPTAPPTASFRTQSPTTAPTSASTTISPTTESTTMAPTSASTTAAPTSASTTMAPTAFSSETQSPTASPTSENPTAAPTSESTTAAPTPSSSNETNSPTASPTSESSTAAPTEEVSTQSPTQSPTEEVNTQSPTQSPTEEVSTQSPTQSPTEEVGTQSPTQSPTADSSHSGTNPPSSIVHEDGETIIVYNYGTLNTNEIGRKRNLRGSN